jgi:catechol 2,3-dioxygenase-like lactoylglutathione lyase family enzyme
MAAPKRVWRYTGLRVQDFARSIRFYRRMGFRVARRGGMQHGGRWVDLVFPGSPHRLELNFYPTTNRFYEPFVRGSEFDHMGFEVDEVEGWARQLRRWRIPLMADFTEGSQRLIYASDPDGNWLEFYGPVGRAPAARRRRA